MCKEKRFRRGRFSERKVFSDFEVLDSDRDNVYDVFDCQPLNPERQEAIQPDRVPVSPFAQRTVIEKPSAPPPKIKPVPKNFARRVD